MNSAWLAVIISLSVICLAFAVYGFHKHSKRSKRRLPIFRPHATGVATTPHTGAVRGPISNPISNPNNPQGTPYHTRGGDVVPHSASGFSAGLTSSITGSFWSGDPSFEFGVEAVGLPMAFSHFSGDGQMRTPRRRIPATPGPAPRDGAHFPLESGSGMSGGVGGLTSPGASHFHGAFTRITTLTRRSPTTTAATTEHFRRSDADNDFVKKSRRSNQRESQQRHTNLGWEMNDDILSPNAVEIEALTPLSGRSFHSAGPSAPERTGLAPVVLGRSSCAVSSAACGSKRSDNGGGEDCGSEGNTSPIARWRNPSMQHLRPHSLQRPSHVLAAPTPYPTNDTEMSYCPSSSHPRAGGGASRRVGLPSSTRGVTPPSRMQQSTHNDERSHKAHQSGNDAHNDVHAWLQQGMPLSAGTNLPAHTPTLRSPRLQLTTARHHRPVSIN